MASMTHRELRRLLVDDGCRYLRDTRCNFDNLPYVETELNYLALMAEGPRYYACHPEPGVPRSRGGDRTWPRRGSAQAAASSAKKLSGGSASSDVNRGSKRNRVPQ